MGKLTNSASGPFSVINQVSTFIFTSDQAHRIRFHPGTASWNQQQCTSAGRYPPEPPWSAVTPRGHLGQSWRPSGQSCSLAGLLRPWRITLGSRRRTGAPWGWRLAPGAAFMPSWASPPTHTLGHKGGGPGTFGLPLHPPPQATGGTPGSWGGRAGHGSTPCTGAGSLWASGRLRPHGSVQTTQGREGHQRKLLLSASSQGCNTHGVCKKFPRLQCLDVSTYSQYMFCGASQFPISIPRGIFCFPSLKTWNMLLT